jgi:hypothetical protein
MAKTWTSRDPRWQALDSYQKAALMALMEADGANPQSARNALGAMINRASKSKEDLGAHVSKPIYQPTIEPAQQARLDRLLKSSAHSDLTAWAKRRAAGEEQDPVSGATHFLAPERVMLNLERSNPAKYKNWGPRGANWTGYDPSTGAYKGVVMRDNSHAFLAPEGAYSVASASPAAAPEAAAPPVLQADYGRQAPEVAQGAIAAAPSEPAPDTGLKAAFSGFVNKPLATMPEALGGKDITFKGLAGAFGPMASAMSGGGDDRAAAQMAQAGAQANAQALSEEDRRQAEALQKIMQRRSRAAFA